MGTILAGAAIILGISYYAIICPVYFFYSEWKKGLTNNVEDDIIKSRKERDKMYKPTEENEWMYKIAQGMALIKEGCSMNRYWENCDWCPFDEYCSAIMDKHSKFGDDMEVAMDNALKSFNEKIFAET